MPPFALAPRTETAERALATTDGRPSRDGALLTERLERRYHDRITGSFTIPGRDGRYAPIPEDVPAHWPMRCRRAASASSTAIRPMRGRLPSAANMWRS